MTGREWDDRVSAWLVGETRHHLVHIIPMIFNHRMVLTPKTDTYTYDVGWCYPSEQAAFAAWDAWDPATQPEPTGYIKRIDWALPDDDQHRQLA